MRLSLNRPAADAIARDIASILTSVTIAVPQSAGWGFNLQALQSASAGFNYDVAIFWNDVMASVPPSWNARFKFGTAYQHQDFESGSTGRNSNANVGVALQHRQWGMFSAAIARGRTEQVTGANVDSQSYQSEYSRPLSKKHTLKFYYRLTRTVDCNAASESRDQSGGLQFVLAQ